MSYSQEYSKISETMLQFLITTLQCDNIHCCFKCFEHIDKCLVCLHPRFLSTSEFLTAITGHVVFMETGKFKMIDSFSLTTHPKMKVVQCIVDF